MCVGLGTCACNACMHACKCMCGACLLSFGPPGHCAPVSCYTLLIDLDSVPLHKISNIF